MFDMSCVDQEARQRQVEHLKNMMDAEQERAQEQRMLKRLATLQQAGHDVSGLKAHYEGQHCAHLPYSSSFSFSPVALFRLFAFE